MNPMQGYPQLKISNQKLLEYLDACIAAGVKYGLGSKDPTPRQTLPIDFKHIDCSGFFREAIFHSTDMATLPPDGSTNQNDWCARMGFKRSDFPSTKLADNRVRVAFKRAKGKGDVGHVWLILNGKTLESWSRHGVGSRAWDTPVLRKIVTDVYVLADAPPAQPAVAAPAAVPA